MALEASAAERRAWSRVSQVRWPYRVLAVDSPACRLNLTSPTDLLRHGVDLRPYADGATALVSLLAEDPALVLAPTDLVGVDFPRFVRAVVGSSEAPVIVGLTTDPESSVLAFQALELGARALLALPFAAEQLTSAIHQMGLRQTLNAAPLSYGPVALDRRARLVRVAGTPLALSPKEYLLVEYLLSEAPRVVSSAEIATVIDVDPGQRPPHTVRKYVQRLRDRLAAAGAGQLCRIDTVRGLGYRLSVTAPHPC